MRQNTHIRKETDLQEAVEVSPVPLQTATEHDDRVADAKHQRVHREDHQRLRPSPDQDGLTICAGGASMTETIAAIQTESFSAEGGERWRTRDIEQILQMPTTSVLVASQGFEPLGFSMMRWAADEAEVLLLAVRPRFQKTGVGTALIRASVAHVLTQSVKRICLEVRANNKSAHALYTKHGFRQIGRRPNYYRLANGEAIDATTMAKTIG
ncbi:MAG: ribosomal protein S18-alanine N-acetyltransferase [Pseudomonadota bacterium]